MRGKHIGGRAIKGRRGIATENGDDVISILYLVLTIGVGVWGCSGVSHVFAAICGPILFAALLTLFLFSLAGGVGDRPTGRR
jgi:hypothetical protein